MKTIVLFFAVLLFVIVGTHVHAQDKQYGPNRAALHVLSEWHTLEVATDSEIKKIPLKTKVESVEAKESLQKSFVLVQIVDSRNKNSRFFRCTREELIFLQDQLKKYNIRLLLENKYFIGFTKTV